MWQRSKDDAAMESAMGQLASDDATVGQSAKARWQQIVAAGHGASDEAWSCYSLDHALA